MLKGHTVLVVGASRGIGAAIAVRCARERAALVLAARSLDKLQEVAERCRAAGAATCAALRCDVADGASIQCLEEEVQRRHPEGLDALMIVSGVAVEKQDILTGDPDEWEAMLAINTLAPMRLTRAFAPAMAARGRGAIVTVGSLAGTLAAAGSAPYASSKWGVRGWVLSMYEELRKHGIKTTVIEPGFVATDMVAHNKRLLPENMIRPEDVAEAALLPLHMSPNAVPLEITLKCVLSPYRSRA